MPTNNKGYNLPSQGDTGWNQPLNDNFKLLDKHIEVRGQGSPIGSIDPTNAVKYLDTDTGEVYLSDGSTWTQEFEQLQSAGRYLSTNNGTFNFSGPAEWSNDGTSSPNTVSGTASTVVGGVNNEASGDYSTALGRNAAATNSGAFVVGDSTSNAVSSQNPDENRFQGQIICEDYIETGYHYFTGSSLFLNTFEDSNTGNDVLAVSVPDTYGIPITQWRVNEFGDVRVTGDFNVDGNKNFVQPVETDEGEREVVYTASEAAEARTEASGVATIEDGRAVIDLPDHFEWVTSDDEPIIVQTTPYASEQVQPQVTERSTDRIVIEDFAGVDEYEVAYTVKGTRDGHEDKQVVREPTASGPAPTPADD